MARMTRVLLLLIVSAASTVCTNDTLNNAIPSGDEVDSPERAEEDATRRNISLEQIYKDAVQSYLEEDWDGCIEGFNEALHRYKLYKRMVTNCRQKCRTEAAGAAPFFAENIEDLHFYERKVRETFCLMACNKDYRQIAGSKSLNRLPVEIERKFVGRRAYEHLHICYYKRNRYPDAANAIFTFLAQHPDHEASVKTLMHYLTLPDVKQERVVDLESSPYVTLYFKGVSAYDDQDYKEAVGLFENSLRAYMEAEEECRFYCEGPFDQGWHPEFTSSVANHFTYCLKCKHVCHRALDTINGEHRPDILKTHYDYLQFSYYKLGKLKQACAAVQSYLLFEPADETMLHNKIYYSAQPKVTQEYFVPREEALSYMKRQMYERRILRFMWEEYAAATEKVEKKTKRNSKDKADELGKESSSRPDLHPPPGHSPVSQSQLTSNLSMIRAEDTEIRGGQDRGEPKVRDDVYLIAKESELGGKSRYVADGFLNSTECESLMQLAHVAAVEGDGYDENRSPHSAYETFEGLTIGRVALMVYFGQLEPKILELLLGGTNAAREHVKRYFELDRQLYFTYTHLVCRTALPDSPADRNDLSHEIHADNCLLRDRSTCSRESPAYVWRDYSAILYLNDDFEGGEFFFAKGTKSHEAQGAVSPRCGRMVAFSAGVENLHGVRGVLEGRRCALALWFTMDEKYLEYERELARVILKRVHDFGVVRRTDFRVPLRYEDVLIQHFKKDELLRQLLRDAS